MLDSLMLTAAQAARHLGVSQKALRLYESHGLLRPLRSASGWRHYRQAEMERAREIVVLRRLGLSLSSIARILNGASDELERALASHVGILERQSRDVLEQIAAVAELRKNLAAGRRPDSSILAGLLKSTQRTVAFDLPWPWGGERFVYALPPVTWLTGPLGSGKTRLAEAIASAIPGAVFAELKRPRSSTPYTGLLQWLVDEGASDTPRLRELCALLVDPTIPALVVDLVEDGLDEQSQQALSNWLRHYSNLLRPLVLMTRSSAMLDIEYQAPDVVVLYCPANHGTPLAVLPRPGAAGYDAVADCLASPTVRERTQGMVARMPEVTAP